MIVVLNGPAGCGKDTIANRILEVSSVFKKAEMKAPMWEIAKATLGSNFEKFVELYNDRATKEKPCDMLGGLSPRNFFIHISEKWCKPLFGDTYFGGRMLQTAISNKHHETILSDGGFSVELMPALDAGETIMLVRLHREGYTFDGDSRSYIHIEHKNCWSLDVKLEDGKIDEAVEGILDAYQTLLKAV